MKEIMTLKETIEYFDVTDKTLLNWEKQGLKPVRLSKKMKFYQKEELLKFFENIKNRRDWG